MRRHLLILAVFVIGSAVTVTVNSAVPLLTGRAFDAVLGTGPDRAGGLAVVSLALLAAVVARGGFDLTARLTSQVLAKRLERDARDELYLNLLGKSHTFHNRQRVGDLMARVANDIRQLSQMVNPGLDQIIDSSMQGFIALLFIAAIDHRLLLVPTLFLAMFVLALWHYMRQLGPVSTRMRSQFGDLNAGLNEVVRGIEVVKVAAQEPQERRRFGENARRYRDSFVRNGLIQARYLPTLLLAVALAGALWHGLVLYDAGALSLGDVVAFMGLFWLLSVPTMVSLITYPVVQLGIASARRILTVMNTATELDHNPAGHQAPMRGEIVFENVTFGYDDGATILNNVTFVAKPGETVAIVGETGAGKSTLTKLLPRIYDVHSGRILVDGVDIREWNLDSLRSQISTIEQDVVLFSRSVAENIAFSLGQRADRFDVEQAIKDAQAHEFIKELDHNIDTVLGDRGVNLSGGQRQRLAIARALITNPAVLVLDDSTSAIDSATEDRIQTAINRMSAGRTTLLITYRLSQIRRADKVVLLRRGQVVDCGGHDELLQRCSLYRRLFARYNEVRLSVGTGNTNGPDQKPVA
ncbi:ABC transporter ATP-binding protein [Phytoactinopolyspora limicola]|uniref:ABC transporter ATP-binding protein n=1 Tax=Phytoactinopolyspora limicola TaxID=2715536 RepID=UPI001A9C475D|nr:ABC transporter ATP-binding protein [Phytoactinopolyspora limicola]